MGTGLLDGLFVALGIALFQRVHVHEQLFFEVQQEQAHAGAVHRVARHQLGMGEALINVLVDDVRFVQDQVTFHQDGHLAVRVHHADLFGLVVQIHVADLEVHALLEQHKAATVGIRARSSRIKHHHGGSS